MEVDTGSKDKTSPQFLSGWKEIATYLDKGVRTVQRYEREFGLPVRRPAGRPRGSVVATRVELDAWVTASPIRDEYELSPKPAGFAEPPLEQIKNGMKEMSRLRDQMMELRRELESTVALVRDSVGELGGALTPAWEHNNVLTSIAGANEIAQITRNLPPPVLESEASVKRQLVV